MAAQAEKIKDWTIYKITNPNGKIYIGITNNIKRRMNDYARADCINQQAIYRSIVKYGFCNHIVEEIDKFKSNVEYALGKEIFWIRSFMSNAGKFPLQLGLNMTDGGRGHLGKKMSDETKEKLRKINLGKKLSPETLLRLSEIRKGRKTGPWTDERKNKMRQLKLASNFKHTDEAKKKISEASIGNKWNVGKKQSKEHISKRVEKLIGNKFNVGRKQSPELIEKRICKIRGIKRTESQIENMRMAQILKNGKPILVYDLSGIFVKEFLGINLAARELGVKRENIKDALIKRGNNIFGQYIFKYKNQ